MYESSITVLTRAADNADARLAADGPDDDLAACRERVLDYRAAIEVLRSAATPTIVYDAEMFKQ
jgi:hypothetical protein